MGLFKFEVGGWKLEVFDACLSADMEDRCYWRMEHGERGTKCNFFSIKADNLDYPLLLIPAAEPVEAIGLQNVRCWMFFDRGWKFFSEKRNMEKGEGNTNLTACLNCPLRLFTVY